MKTDNPARSPTARALIVVSRSHHRLMRVRRLVDVLDSMGYTVDLLSHMPPAADDLPLVNRLVLRSLTRPRGLYRILRELVYYPLREAWWRFKLPTPVLEFAHAALWGPWRLPRPIRDHRYGLVIVEELFLLPLAFAVARHSNARVIAELRDFYWGSAGFSESLQPSNSRRDRHSGRAAYSHLVKKYLPRTSAQIVVSDGQRDRLREFCEVDPVVIRSLPHYEDVSPSPVYDARVKLVYHGAAERERQLEVIIDAVIELGERYSLDLYLPSETAYARELKRRAATAENIGFPTPVAPADLVRSTTAYDIGVAIFPASNGNLATALPNKFFEYVQARLAVLTAAPSQDMSRLAAQLGFGITAEQSSVEAVVACLASLSSDRIAELKSKAHAAASVLCFEAEAPRLREVLGRASAQRSVP